MKVNRGFMVKTADRSRKNKVLGKKYLPNQRPDEEIAYLNFWERWHTLQRFSQGLDEGVDLLFPTFTQGHFFQQLFHLSSVNTDCFDVDCRMFISVKCL